MRIHISLLSCRGEEKMPARPCPIRSVRSGPVRPVCPVRAPWAQGTGADRTDRTGPDRAGTARWPSLAWPCPVRPVRSSALGPGRPDRTDRTGPDRTPDHLIFVLFLFEKRWSGAPKQAFGPKVMECCSKASFWTKSYGVLLQNKILLQK